MSVHGCGCRQSTHYYIYILLCNHRGNKFNFLHCFCTGFEFPDDANASENCDTVFIFIALLFAQRKFSADNQNDKTRHHLLLSFPMNDKVYCIEKIRRN